MDNIEITKDLFPENIVNFNTNDSSSYSTGKLKREAIEISIHVDMAYVNVEVFWRHPSSKNNFRVFLDESIEYSDGNTAWKQEVKNSVVGLVAAMQNIQG